MTDSNTSSTPSVVLLETKGEIRKTPYEASVIVDVPRKGVADNFRFVVSYNGSEYVITEQEVLAHLVERGITRNTQDNNKSIDEAAEWLSVNAEGYLSPKKKEQALRPVPEKPTSKRGRPASSPISQENIISYLELHPATTSAGKEAYKAVGELSPAVFKAIMARPDDELPEYLANARAELLERAKREEEKRIEAEKAAIESLL